jgi:hypothetical protein
MSRTGKEKELGAEDHVHGPEGGPDSCYLYVYLTIRLLGSSLDLGERFACSAREVEQQHWLREIAGLIADRWWDY